MVEADAVLDVTGSATASRIAFTQSATSCGSPMRHAPKLPVCTRSDGTRSSG